MVASVLLFVIGKNRILFAAASVGFVVMLWLVWPAGNAVRLTVICCWVGTILTVPVHELGHVLAARRVGAQTLRVGWENGVAFVETERLSRRSTAIVAAAGPATSALVAVSALMTSWLLSLPIFLGAAVPWILSALSIVPPARDGMLVFTGRASRRDPATESARPGVEVQERSGGGGEQVSLRERGGLTEPLPGSPISWVGGVDGRDGPGTGRRRSLGRGR